MHRAACTALPLSTSRSRLGPKCSPRPPKHQTLVAYPTHALCLAQSSPTCLLALKGQRYSLESMRRMRGTASGQPGQNRLDKGVSTRRCSGCGPTVTSLLCSALIVRQRRHRFCLYIELIFCCSSPTRRLYCRKTLRANGRCEHQVLFWMLSGSNQCDIV